MSSATALNAPPPPPPPAAASVPPTTQYSNHQRPISPESQLMSDTNYDSLATNESDATTLSSSNATNFSLDQNNHESLGSSATNESSDDHDLDDDNDEKPPCLAVHALDRDMPDYDYTPQVEELRRRILANIADNPGLYGRKEVLKCQQDDWFLARFLLRHKMDMELAYDMLKRTMRYHNESLCTLIKAEDFPAEFYMLGGTFSYEPDRCGNVTMYMRVKVHRKTPEIKAVVESFLYYNLLQTDELAKGKGVTLVMDCTGGGLQSADIELLFFLVSNLRNYFPKGLSYILVHNLPWILKPFWHLAKNWVPDEHRELIKFSNDKTIFQFIDKQNLPDFMGGSCARDYRQAPPNCTNLREAIKFWGLDVKVAKSILGKFRENLPPTAVANLEREFEELDRLVAVEKVDEFPKTPETWKHRIAEA